MYADEGIKENVKEKKIIFRVST